MDFHHIQPGTLARLMDCLLKVVRPLNLAHVTGLKPVTTALTVQLPYQQGPT